MFSFLAAATAMETRAASRRSDGLTKDGLLKDLSTTASHTAGQNGAECNPMHVQSELQDEQTGSTPKTAELLAVALTPDAKIEREVKPVGSPEEGNDESLRCSSLEKE